MIFTQCCYILTQLFTNLYIICPNKCCVLIGIHFSVYHNNRNSSIIGLRYNRCYGIGFIRRDNQQIHFLIQKISDILYLLLTVIFHGTDFQFHVTFYRCLTKHLLILFVTPLILAALRNAYQKLILRLGTRPKKGH